MYKYLTHGLIISLTLVIILCQVCYRTRLDEKDYVIEELKTYISTLEEENKQYRLKDVEHNIKYCDLMGEYNRLKDQLNK